MPIGTKLVFSALLLCAGAVGYWVEKQTGTQQYVPYLAGLVSLLMLGLWSMSAVQKKDND